MPNTCPAGVLAIGRHRTSLKAKALPRLRLRSHSSCGAQQRRQDATRYPVTGSYPNIITNCLAGCKCIVFDVTKAGVCVIRRVFCGMYPLQDPKDTAVVDAYTRNVPGSRKKVRRTRNSATCFYILYTLYTCAATSMHDASTYCGLIRCAAGRPHSWSTMRRSTISVWLPTDRRP